MPEFRVTVERTVKQTKTVLVTAESDEAVWLGRYTNETDLSDWSTTTSEESTIDVEARS